MIGIIGVGKWGKNHVRVCKELASEGVLSDNPWIADVDPDRILELSRRLEVNWAKSYQDMLSLASIKGVIIATPSRTHYEIAKMALKWGKDVLIEKPMTMNIGEADELVGLAAKEKRILMVGHIFRYHPAVQELKRRIGDLGEIQNIIGHRFDFGVPRKDMGVIYALGIHELDLFCWLMGVAYPKRIKAFSTHTYSQDVEDTASIVMDFGKAKGYALESWLVSAYGKWRDLVVVGSKGSARVDYLNGKELQLFDENMVLDNGVPVGVQSTPWPIIPDSPIRTIAIPYAEPLKEEIKHFISCIISRSAPLTDGNVGLRAVVMCEEALASARNGL